MARAVLNSGLMQAAMENKLRDHQDFTNSQLLGYASRLKDVESQLTEHLVTIGHLNAKLGLRPTYAEHQKVVERCAINYQEVLLLRDEVKRLTKALTWVGKNVIGPKRVTPTKVFTTVKDILPVGALAPTKIRG